MKLYYVRQTLLVLMATASLVLAESYQGYDGQDQDYYAEDQDDYYARDDDSLYHDYAQRQQVKEQGEGGGGG
jgi:hypothetical protein